VLLFYTGIGSFGWRDVILFRAMLAVMGNGVVRQVDLATGLLARVTSTTFGIGCHLDATSRRALRYYERLGSTAAYLSWRSFPGPRPVVADEPYAEYAQRLCVCDRGRALYVTPGRCPCASDRVDRPRRSCACRV
jgi:hypothetical protein